MTKNLKLLIASLLVGIGSQAQVVTTFAGTGSFGSTDGTGTAASFKRPQGVCTDASGNMYVADTENNSIRKITPAGVVTTFAGSGTAGSIDDIGTGASFNGPSGLCIDASGNIYVADYSNHKIRKITPSGTVSTFVGNGILGSTDGSGANVKFNNPSGICIDASGNLYVADRGNNKIRKITPAGLVSTFAGSGSSGSTDATGTAASFSWPHGIAIDASDNIYVADYGNNKIRKITPARLVSTLAGSGTYGSVNGVGTAAGFAGPRGVCVGASGDTYVADTESHIIRKITPSGVVTTFAGSGTPGFIDAGAAAAGFWYPYGVFADATGNIYVSDSENHSIRKITLCATPSAPVNATPFANTQLCKGNSTSLTATSTGTVSWYNNPTGGTAMSTGTIITTSTTLTAGTYTYYAEASTCTVSATRTAITITVNPTPTITVNSGVICSGNSFTVSPGGASTYTISGGTFIVNPNSTSSYTVTGQNTNGCIGTAVTTISVNPTFTPAISISTPSNTICGSSAVFSSTITNGGSSPTYQWKKNGTNVGSNISTYSPSSLVNGDVIYCQLTSNLACASPTAVSSNSITITVNSSVSPTMLISTPSTTICGSSAVFSSTITNGGSAPIYQWKKNGSNVGSNISTYSPSSLVNGDVISCELTSNLACASPTAVSSNSITITVNSSVSPTMLISTPSTTICGSSAVFSSTITNGGSAPIYQWKKNGTNVGSNISTYSPSSLVNGDVIYCQLTSNLACASPTAVSSNSITITVNSSVSPTMLISTPSQSICGSSAVFSSTITNGGSAPIYQWKKNGTNVGSNISTYSPSNLVNGDVLSCLLTSNASCISSTSVTSNSITMTINPTPTVTISSSHTLICIGESASLTAQGATSYSWSSGSTSSLSVVSPTSTTTYTATGTTLSGCSASSSYTQVVDVCTFTEQLDALLFNVYPNPSNGAFTVSISAETSITIVNLLGEQVYTNHLKPGDHRIDLPEQPNGIYLMQVQTNTTKKQIRLIKTN